MRPESGRTLLEEAAEAIRGYADDLGVRVRLEPPRPGIVLNVDRDRFIQVLNNLLSNAVKFSPEDGEIELRCRGAERDASASWCATTGREFRPNARTACSTNSSRRMHRPPAKRAAPGWACISAGRSSSTWAGRSASRAQVGEGTTMWVELPALHRGRGGAAAARTALPAELGRKVLVCEDDDRVAWLIQKMLTKEGFAADVVLLHSRCAAAAEGRQLFGDDARPCAVRPAMAWTSRAS